ncbi:hypothetical protein C2845_PM13G12390 [Panicum miliaceum]|uniref:F-box domain-containing protein n=1 Tax=Panicum miliaceum TaxID=4540 RepID=A0A3L6RJD1_PANMI|nr:hypothetical protein C2845_PM13G12390 [Panicum miliaceum]
MATAEVQPVLPDELLEDIFLRLDDAADLARASAACTSFRRVVSSRRFLRRFRSPHTLPVLGFLEFIGVAGLHFHHAGPPHRSAMAARALAQAADFSFSFLPKDPLKSCRVCDARDGRVLLGRSTSGGWGFGDLVVCDPLYRRYVQIPLITDDPVASALHSGQLEFESGWLEAFLAPPGEDEEEDALSFQVICNVLYEDKVVAFVFSSVTGEWLRVASFSFLPYGCIEDPESLVRHNIRGCFYWRHHTWNNLLVLDTCEMKFSVVDPPPDSLNRQWAVADAGEDRLDLIAIDQCALDFYCKTLQNIGLGTDKWRHEKRISLPEINCNWSIIGTAEGCFLLLASPQDFFSFRPEMPKAQYFTLEIKTLLVERQCVARRFVYCACLYASFPPPLSLPSI